MDTARALKNRAQIGAHSAGATPVTIPNTEVKPSSGYNTWVIKPWENSKVPSFEKAFGNEGLFFC